MLTLADSFTLRYLRANGWGIQNRITRTSISMGRRSDYLKFERTGLHCYGPPASNIREKAGSLPSNDPLFHVVSGPLPDKAKSGTS